MKYLIFLFCFNAYAATSSCIEDPKADYQKEFSLPKIENWKVMEVELKKDQLPDLNITTDEQCGAKGCEGALYLQKEKGCFKRVLFYNGSLKVLPAVGSPMAQIQVGQKIYKYNSRGEKYE